jgi:hypothetical protein
MRTARATTISLAALVLIAGPTAGVLAQSPATPLQSPSADASMSLIDTSSWTPYVSDRYGFTIGHPADWSERAATGDWDLSAAANFLSPATEGFRAPGSAILVTAWSAPVEPGMTADDWIGAYCPMDTAPCTGLGDLTVPVMVDGHPGSVVRFADDTQAFILVDDRMYVVAVWEPDSDPRTSAYGGAVRLLEGYLSTMHLSPGGQAGASPTAATPSPS